MLNILRKKHSLDSLFFPKSIAVVGASENTSKIGGFIFSEIKKVKSVTPYPINNKSEYIQGYKAYSSISNIPKTPDLVIIVIPGIFVLDILRECVKKKVKNVVVISAGFKETGEEGKKKEDEIRTIVKEHKINLVGPNCLGIINGNLGLNCSFAKDIPQQGDIALISQSGAVIDAIIDWSFKHNIGFSKVVSLGNMAGIDELQMLEYLKNDPKTKSILFYMETLEKGKEFGKVLREVSKKKPVIIINPGKSSNAKKAIGSHTGSLAKDSILVETILKENNAILVENFTELFNVLIGLNVKPPKNNNVAILTNAGGPGVIATDVLEHTNFKLCEFSQKEKEVLKGVLPKEASVNNPVDVLGDAQADRYEIAIKSMLEFKEVDSILVLLTPQVMTNSEDIAKMIEKHHKKKTIFSSFIGDKEVKKAIEYLDKNNFANFQTPNEALIAMDKIFKYSSFNYSQRHHKYNFDQTEIKKIKEILKHEKGLLDFDLTKRIFELFAIKLPEKHVFRKEQDLTDSNLNKNKKYVLKVDGIIHKKDIGGVRLGITKESFISTAQEMFSKLSKDNPNISLTLEEEVSGAEVIVGLKSDEELGNFIMFGMGGTFVSIFNDVHFATCPLTLSSTKKLVESSKVYELLKGYRGSKPIHFNHLYEVLIRMSYLQEIFPEIKEVDLNPIICSEKGIFLVDVKLLV